jgi:hypothetical protein
MPQQPEGAEEKYIAAQREVALAKLEGTSRLPKYPIESSSVNLSFAFDLLKSA